MANKPNPRRQPQPTIPPVPTEATTSQQVITQITAEASWTSPIPPPAVMAQYNQIMPNGADRILRMVEDQHAHRISLESLVVRGDQARSFQGLLCSTIVSLAALGVSLAAILSGQGVIGLAIVLAEVGVLAGIFLRTDSNRRQERQDRLRAMSGPPPSANRAQRR